jgi:hypothetical protein
VNALLLLCFCWHACSQLSRRTWNVAQARPAALTGVSLVGNRVSCDVCQFACQLLSDSPTAAADAPQAQDNSLWAHGLRNTKSTTTAESTGGSAPDPVKIDQHAVLRALQLTPQQEKAILGGTRGSTAHATWQVHMLGGQRSRASCLKTKVLCWVLRDPDRAPPRAQASARTP